MRTLTGLAIAMLLLGLCPALAQQPTTTTTPAAAGVPDLSWAVGDTWTWRRPDSKNVTWTVTSVTADQYLVTSEGPDFKNLGRIPRNPTSLTATPAAGAGNPLLKMEFPLSVGQKATAYLTGTTVGGAVANSWRTDWNVTRVESVTVPAGTFDAYRADGTECNITVNDCGTVQVWFASQAKNVVKIAWGGDHYWSTKVRDKSEVLIRYQVY